MINKLMLIYVNKYTIKAKLKFKNIFLNNSTKKKIIKMKNYMPHEDILITTPPKNYFVISHMSKQLVIKLDPITDQNLSSQTLCHLSKLYKKDIFLVSSF